VQGLNQPLTDKSVTSSTAAETESRSIDAWLARTHEAVAFMLVRRCLFRRLIDQCKDLACHEGDPADQCGHAVWLLRSTFHHQLDQVVTFMPGTRLRVHRESGHTNGFPPGFYRALTIGSRRLFTGYKLAARAGCGCRGRHRRAPTGHTLRLAIASGRSESRFGCQSDP
jgi:hypothetical protein